MRMAQAAHHDQNRVLVIEKDAHTAYLLDYVLSREGFSVLSTNSCQSACIMMHTMLPPGIVFLDLSLSREHDFAFLHRIRGMPGWQSVPVILLSENFAYHAIDPALKEGATDYIVLPFNPAELMIHMQRHSLSAVH